MKLPAIGFTFLTIIISLLISPKVNACTNFIVSKGASADKSVMITYAADSHTRYGAIAFYPAADHKPGSMCQVFHYENGKKMGEIPEAPHTYSVVQFMNEHQVAVGETTFGGLDSLSGQPGSFLDYGSLMKIGLQRSRTAREFIKVITDLVAVHGYASGGESFSISDKNEAWIMEIIGKGKYEKGAVWVAMLVPEGYVSGHANQARITTFPFQKTNDWTSTTQSVYHSADVITFAKNHAFYSGKDTDFSFSDVYNPVNFGGARFCDARVWSFFRTVNSEVRNNPSFTSYALGEIEYADHFPDGSKNRNHFATNRLPLWVKVDKKVDISLVMEAMRNHYEDTPLDMLNDPGAGPFKIPYRWRPMEFKLDSVEYLNERAVATQQTGYSFIAQSRSWMPDEAGGIYWFGVDDADGCVYLPVYCGVTGIPESYAVGNGSMITWSETSAFWTFNQMTNWVYTRYNVMHPEIERIQKVYEDNFKQMVAQTDSVFLMLHEQDSVQAVELITTFSQESGDQLVSDWKDFYHYMLMKYIDGNIKQCDDMMLRDNGNGKNIPPSPRQPGYGEEWNRIMIMGTGDRLKVKGK